MSVGEAFSQHPVLFGVLGIMAVLFIAGLVLVGLNTLVEAL